MAQYCVWVSVPKYGPRDEVTGERHHRGRCFKQLRTAKKKARALSRKIAYDEGRVSLCRGLTFCGPHHGGKQVSLRRKARKSPPAARKRAHDDIPF